MDITGLEVPKGLSALVDRDAFVEMCERFCELHGVGVHVMDLSGATVADVRTTSSAYFDYLLTLQDGKTRYSELIAELKSVAIGAGETGVEVEGFNGLCYRVLAILHEGTEYGRIIFGPFQKPSPSEKALVFEKSLSRLSITVRR